MTSNVVLTVDFYIKKTSGLNHIIYLYIHWQVFQIILSRDMTKPTKLVCPAKTRLSLGIRPVWSESSLSAWRNLWSLATHWVHREDSDQIGQMPRLIWVFAGCTLILLVLSCCGSFIHFQILMSAVRQIHVSMAAPALTWLVDTGVSVLPNGREISVKLVTVIFEPRHEKTCFCHVRITKAQISLRIQAFLSVPLLFAA